MKLKKIHQFICEHVFQLQYIFAHFIIILGAFIVTKGKGYVSKYVLC